MSRDFGYINARVRGMSSRLLGPETYAAALGADDFRAFTALLAQTPYGSDLEEAQARYEGLRAVDRALANHVFDTTRSLLSFSDGAPREMIAALLVRYDLEDVKTVVRAKHAGRSEPDLATKLSGAGGIRPATLEAMLAAPDVPAAAQALAVTRHPLARPFVRAARDYAGSGDLFAFELALDHAYYEGLVERAERRDASDVFRRYVRQLVDAANLRTALKLEGRSGDLSGFFLPGGREVNRESFLQVAAQGVPALSAFTTGTFSELSGAVDRADAERRIRTALDGAARRAALHDPLGIGVVIRFLRDKENEAAKLRLLARGAFYHVPRADLEKELNVA